MPAYNTVLFDLLTALLDSRSLWNAVARNQQDGERWRAAYLRLCYQTGAYRPYLDLVADAAQAVALPRSLALDLDARYAELEPWPDANETLRALKSANLKLGNVTNCSERLSRLAARKLQIDFDTLVTAESAGFYKPHPRPYQQAMADLNSTPARTLFVAGSAYDMFGTTPLGLTTYWHNRAAAIPPRDAPVPQMQERSLTPLLAIAG